MSSINRIEALRQKYRKQLAAAKVFESIKQQLNALKPDIEEISKVSDSSISFSEEEMVITVTLDGKRSIISLDKNSNEIVAKRLEDNIAVEIYLLVEEEDEVSIKTNVVPIYQKFKKEEATPEFLLSTLLNELFFDVTQR
ncbi:hypothetical protein ABWW12_01980 [Bacillus subtilis]|uniref:hypothetical protein n=1 Tax=Bacillus subtilis TaxID=1423 RepID=UPI00018CC86B|nr:hypothetical protein [Bacillus subtilis]QGI00208.1 hypothetical protein GII77_06940 [Bacillus subtilis]